MFTKILYINLDRRPDRNDHIHQQLQKINWTGDVERISAIDGRQLDLNSISHLISNRASQEASNTQKIEFAPGSYMTKGAVGCALSHREAWNAILNGHHDKVLILEDDIRFDDNFNDKLVEYLSNIPDYDLLYIGYHETWTKEQSGPHYRVPNDVVFGLYGYIVDKRIAKKLLDMFPIEGQIDSEIKKIYPDIKVYHVNEDQRIIHSDHSFNNNLGTDIQVIEGYENISNNNYISIILIIIMILIIIYLIQRDY
jgi:GR25 family glycosyltransferase involved in LPS biosynthesis